MIFNINDRTQFDAMMLCASNYPGFSKSVKKAFDVFQRPSNRFDITEVIFERSSSIVDGTSYEFFGFSMKFEKTGEENVQIKYNFYPVIVNGEIQMTGRRRPRWSKASANSTVFWPTTLSKVSHFAFSSNWM